MEAIKMVTENLHHKGPRFTPGPITTGLVDNWQRLSHSKLLARLRQHVIFRPSHLIPPAGTIWSKAAARPTSLWLNAMLRRRCHCRKQTNSLESAFSVQLTGRLNPECTVPLF
jgi:hypothetical protein